MTPELALAAVPAAATTRGLRTSGSGLADPSATVDISKLAIRSVVPLG